MSADVNGTTITGPTLVYHDEVPRSVSSMVICRSAVALWHFPNGNSVDQFDATSNEDFLQLLVISTGTSRLIRHREVSALTNTSLNGLWSCRLNGDESGAISVGIYSSGGGE